jgi:predicted nuclease of predicted toxin-antitoxin system
MRILVDECLPRQLRHWLLAERSDWTVVTVQDSGWASMKNGILLREANGMFDVLVTADRNMHHQQNFVGLTISVLVFPANKAKLVQEGVAALVQSLPRIGPGEKAIMELAAGSNWNAAKLAEVVQRQGIAHHLFKAQIHG